MLRVSAKNERREASRLYNELDKTDFQAKVFARKNFCLKRWFGAFALDCPFAVKYLFICASVFIEKMPYKLS